MTQLANGLPAEKQHSDAWVMFTYICFAVSLGMVAGGILLMGLNDLQKGYLLLAMLMLVQSCITLTKTLRDNHETRRFVNRLEDARTEALLIQAGISPAAR
jgi:hypothetical protein